MRAVGAQWGRLVGPWRPLPAAVVCWMRIGMVDAADAGLKMRVCVLWFGMVSGPTILRRAKL